MHHPTNRIAHTTAVRFVPRKFPVQICPEAQRAQRAQRAHRAQRAQRAHRAERSQRAAPREAAFGRWPLAAGCLAARARSLATGEAKQGTSSCRVDKIHRRRAPKSSLQLAARARSGVATTGDAYRGSCP